MFMGMRLKVWVQENIDTPALFCLFYFFQYIFHIKPFIERKREKMLPLSVHPKMSITITTGQGLKPKELNPGLPARFLKSNHESSVLLLADAWAGSWSQEPELGVEIRTPKWNISIFIGVLITGLSFYPSMSFLKTVLIYGFQFFSFAIK